MGKGNAEKFVEQEEKRGKAFVERFFAKMEKNRVLAQFCTPRATAARNRGKEKKKKKKKRKEEQKEKIGVNYAISIV